MMMETFFGFIEKAFRNLYDFYSTKIYYLKYFLKIFFLDRRFKNQGF